MTKFALFALSLLLACGNPAPGSAPGVGAGKGASDPMAQAAVVQPPFAVQGEGEGLLLVWYDAEGAAHPAHARSEVPEDRRARVRVDSLDVAPDQRLDPAFMYVADLRKAHADGSYEVRKVAREAFEGSLSKPKPEMVAVASASDVIIYGASWCGACKQAKRFFRDKGVAFIEKDIEKEPGARSEMQQKARAQGVSTGGIPVLDVRGTMMGGFDPNAVERILASKGT